MKKLTLAIIVICSFQIISAQYCGNSGGGQCTSPGQLTVPGFGPPYTQAAPLINGVTSNPVVEFLNYDTMTFSGQVLTMDSLAIDTITNLPPGLCWSTNKPNNSFSNMEDACIRLTGTPCGVPGQYKLHMIATLYTNLPFPITVNLDAAGLYYMVRLINSGENLPAVDTTQTDATPIIYYGPVANCQVGPFAVSLGNNQTICNNSSVILNPVVTGGTAPYTYSWQGTGSLLSCTNCSSPAVNINQNSTYTVSVTDGSSQVTTAHVTYSVSGNSNHVQLVISNTNISCTSATDRTTLTINNANVPYTLNWGDGFTQTGIVYSTNLHTYTAAGVYPVVVTDGNGCASSVFDTITNTGIVVTLSSSLMPNCWGTATGSIGVTSTGGTPPYNYSWSIGATTSSISNIAPGNYSVTVSDAVGCHAVFYNYLSPGWDPWGYYTYVNTTDANCGNNGSATVSVFGGIPPYTYAWSNGSTTQNLSSLYYGQYLVSVTDSAGCVSTGSANVASNCYTYIRGFAYVDLNDNCVYDAGESPLSNLYITAVSSTGDDFYGNTDLNGNFVIEVSDTGNYNIVVNDYFGSGIACGNLALCGNSHQLASVRHLGDTLSGYNVALQGSSGFDLDLHPGWTPADPGFEKEYWVMPFNQSSLPFTGPATIVFNYDPNLIYEYSLAPFLPAVDTVAHTLTWQINTVPSPGFDWDNVRFQNFFLVPATLSLNYQLQSDFRITPVIGDCDSSNNHFHYSETVIGSHDPNEKSVVPAGPVTADDSILTYTIQFQNTGTDSTHFVVIKDTLSPNLDPSTVHNIASSDKVSTFNISGKGILTWTFNPLHIVDSMTNPAGSKRFVSFTVKKKGTLPLGTTISNTASIYFDYNQAVVTNTVIDTESLPVINIVGGGSPVSVKAFPNPFSDVTTITVTGLHEKFNFQLYDVSGRLQQTITDMDNNQFEVHNDKLAKGVYQYRIVVANKPVAHGKLVVE